MSCVLSLLLKKRFYAENQRCYSMFCGSVELAFHVFSLFLTWRTSLILELTLILSIWSHCNDRVWRYRSISFILYRELISWLLNIKLAQLLWQYKNNYLFDLLMDCSPFLLSFLLIDSKRGVSPGSLNNNMFHDTALLPQVQL